MPLVAPQGLRQSRPETELTPRGVRDQRGPAGVGPSGRPGQDLGSLTPEAGRVRPQGEAPGHAGTRAGLCQAEVSEPAGQRAVRGSGGELCLGRGRERPWVSKSEIEGSRVRVLEWLWALNEVPM